MDFSEALVQLKMGRTLYRIIWNDKDRHIVIIPKMVSLDSEDHIGVFNAQGRKVSDWLCSDADLLAEDWHLTKGWERIHGGIFLVETDSQFIADDTYRNEEGKDFTIHSTKDAHYAMPLAVSLLSDLLMIDGIAPQDIQRIKEQEALMLVFTAQSTLASIKLPKETE